MVRLRSIGGMIAADQIIPRFMEFAQKKRRDFRLSPRAFAPVSRSPARGPCSTGCRRTSWHCRRPCRRCRHRHRCTHPERFADRLCTPSRRGPRSVGHGDGDPLPLEGIPAVCREGQATIHPEFHLGRQGEPVNGACDHPGVGLQHHPVEGLHVIVGHAVPALPFPAGVAGRAGRRSSRLRPTTSRPRRFSLPGWRCALSSGTARQDEYFLSLLHCDPPSLFPSQARTAVPAATAISAPPPARRRRWPR